MEYFNISKGELPLYAPFIQIVYSTALLVHRFFM